MWGRTLLDDSATSVPLDQSLLDPPVSAVWQLTFVVSPLPLWTQPWFLSFSAPLLIVHTAVVLGLALDLLFCCCSLHFCYNIYSLPMVSICKHWSQSCVSNTATQHRLLGALPTPHMKCGKSFLSKTNPPVSFLSMRNTPIHSSCINTAKLSSWLPPPFLHPFPSPLTHIG